MSSRTIPWSRLGAEFVVIFLGVTVSLAADDWRTGKEARAAERAALQELRTDLLDDSASLASTIGLLEEIDRSAVWIRRNLDDASVPPDTALRHIRQLGYGDPFRPQTATYRGLQSAGQVGLIRDARIRRSVVDYYEQILPRLIEVESWLEDQKQDYVDVLFDHALTPLSDTATSSWVADGMVFTSSWDDYRRDERVEPAIVLVGVGAGSWVALATETEDAIAGLRALIDSAVAR